MKRSLASLVVTALLCLPCQAGAADRKRADLSWVGSWGYWLQGADIDTLVACPYDLLVIDYSSDGGDDTAYTAEQIGRVQQAGKAVLAYLSIGEAEDYRFYWQPGWVPGNPSFIGPENPEWQGNYKTRYWMKAWRVQVIEPYLDRILTAGFDGVYLDIIDAYYYWGLQGYPMMKTADAMVLFVEAIATYARARAGPDFIVCPQNGLSILYDASRKGAIRYFKTVDCVGVEDLFYSYESEEDKTRRLKALVPFRKHEKPIFNVEYIPPQQYAGYDAQLQAHPVGLFEIIGYAADPDRELDELIIR